MDLLKPFFGNPICPRKLITNMCQIIIIKSSEQALVEIRFGLAGRFGTNHRTEPRFGLPLDVSSGSLCAPFQPILSLVGDPEKMLKNRFCESPPAAELRHLSHHVENYLYVH
jgi:hypothetical protein